MASIHAITADRMTSHRAMRYGKGREGGKEPMKAAKRRMSKMNNNANTQRELHTHTLTSTRTHTHTCKNRSTGRQTVDFFSYEAYHHNLLLFVEYCTISDRERGTHMHTRVDIRIPRPTRRTRSEGMG